MKVRTKIKEEKVPKIDIIKGSLHNPQKEKQSRTDDLGKIEVWHIRVSTAPYAGAQYNFFGLNYLSVKLVSL